MQPTDKDVSLLSLSKEKNPTISVVYKDLLCKNRMEWCGNNRVNIINVESDDDFYKRCRIMKYCCHKSTSAVADGDSKQASEKDQCRSSLLHQIIYDLCNTEIGRTLIYRTIIEVNRSVVGGTGITENRKNHTVLRNNGRCLVLGETYENYGDTFYWARSSDNAACIVLSSDPVRLTCLYRSNGLFFGVPEIN